MRISPPALPTVSTSSSSTRSAPSSRKCCRRNRGGNSRTRVSDEDLGHSALIYAERAVHHMGRSLIIEHHTRSMAIQKSQHGRIDVKGVSITITPKLISMCSCLPADRTSVGRIWFSEPQRQGVDERTHAERPTPRHKQPTRARSTACSRGRASPLWVIRAVPPVVTWTTPKTKVRSPQ